VEATAEIANGTEEQVIVWCELNAESGALRKAIPDAVEIIGSASTDKQRAKRLEKIRGFISGKYRVLICKRKALGFGLNLQHSWNQVSVGDPHSFEQVYQGIGRQLRYGQQHDVHYHVIVTDLETRVRDSITRKTEAHEVMLQEMVDAMREKSLEELRGVQMSRRNVKKLDTASGNGWTLHHGDCVQTIAKLTKILFDLIVYSTPFGKLYAYTDENEDMGNSRSHEEFFEHYKYLVALLSERLKPGRICAVHCMNLPIFKGEAGYIGLYPFVHELARVHMEAGWILHSDITIWKDPVVAAARTHAIQLSYGQLCKDSSVSAPGIPDHFLIFRSSDTAHRRRVPTRSLAQSS